MLASDKGFTVVELLIALAIMGVVLAGLAGLVISSTRFYLAQNGVVQMQADGRVAMDFMVRELRMRVGNPIISTTVATNDTISFDRVEDTGYPSGVNTGTTLNDTSKAWTASAFAPSATAAYTTTIISGTGTGQARTIADNSATRLTLSTAWVTTPDTTSLYIITSNKGFTRTSTSDNVLRYRVGATGVRNPLVENITTHAFSQPDPNTINITLTARTTGLDAVTRQYRSYTLTENVRLRNN